MRWKMKCSRGTLQPKSNFIPDMKLLFLLIVVLWLGLTVLAALMLASAADDLAEALQRRNRRRHNLGKWLKFHGGIK